MWDRIITIVCAVFASSGIWTLILKIYERKHSQNDLLLGLAHDRIRELGTMYLERGYIYADEYENLHDYLYIPYEKRGGNGTGKLIMDKVNKLEIRQRSCDSK